MLAQIVEMVKRAQTSHAPIQKLTDKISNIFVPIVLIVAVLAFDIWYVLLGATAVHALLFAVAVIVIACPCALGLATPTALMVGTARSAKMGVLIKSGEVLEAVNKIDTIVFDKTGTLTKGTPEVTDIVGDEAKLLRIAASLEEQSEHPLASAILDRAKQQQIKVTIPTNFQAVEGKGVQAELFGQHVFVGNEKLAINAQISERLKAQMTALQKAAKTVVVVGENDTVIGLIAIQDVARENAKVTIGQLKDQGLRTVMLTGDNANVARAIATQIGIDDVIADVLPGEKADHIKQLQQSHRVAFVGDGINDALALSTADVGIAMGAGTDIAIESGGIVLVKNDLQGVVRALAISHKTFNRIKLNLFWALFYNVIGIPIAAGVFVGVGLTLSPEFSGLAMALSSISVVGSSLLLNKAKIVDDPALSTK